MLKVGLRDGSFTTASMSGDIEAPKYFEWDRSANAVPRFYTDICLKQVFGQPHPRIAILIEAPPFRTEFLEFAEKYQDEFDYILTYMRDYIARNDPKKWLFYPHGGTRVALKDWHIHRKDRRVSMIASNKTDATGHKLRHAIAAQYGDRIDVLGTINGQWVDKIRGHAPYLYSIVVCGERNDWGFSEHLLDCLGVGTVPIYWGCPEISKFFDASGIIPFSEPGELGKILDSLSIVDYQTRLPAIQANMETAKQYRIAEDWLYLHYRFLFEEDMKGGANV